MRLGFIALLSRWLVFQISHAIRSAYPRRPLLAGVLASSPDENILFMNSPPAFWRKYFLPYYGLIFIKDEAIWQGAHSPVKANVEANSLVNDDCS